MKKGMFFVLLAIMAIVCSCDREPIYRYSYIKQHGLDKVMADSIAGTYEGKLRVVMFDGSEEKFQDENGTWVRTADVDSILNYKYTAGGFSDRRISLPDFPVSWVANCIKDKDQKEALRKLPNTTLQIDYDIKGDQSQRIHMGYISFKVHPVELSFEMNGEEHVAELFFNDNSVWALDADDKDTWIMPNLGIDLTQLRIDGKVTYFFNDQWGGDYREFFIFISHTNKVGK